jgi:hypothetical protein
MRDETDALAVTQSPDGEWQVTNAAGAVLATCSTNAEAWRALDRMTGEPQTRGQALSDWIWRKSNG